MITTQHFFNNLDRLSKNDKFKDDDFFIMNISQELLDIYMDHFEGKVFDCIYFFHLIIKNNTKSIITLTARLCIDIINLKVGIKLKDEQKQKESVNNINKILLDFNNL